MPTISEFSVFSGSILWSNVMHKVTSVQAKAGYTLAITFDDGIHGEISIADRLFGPMFEPLKDLSFFAQVSVVAQKLRK